jgi:O-antigen/teichoic acid export membrane protein
MSTGPNAAPFTTLPASLHTAELAAPSPEASELTRSSGHAKLGAAAKHAFVLGDQAIVSGSNFLTSVALARGLSLADFGQYSLIWMSVLFGTSIQLALLTSPMMSIGPIQKRVSQSTYLGVVMMHQLLFTTCSTLLLATILGFLHFGLSIVPANLLLPLLFANAAYQLQDFARRVLFYLNKPVAAVINDCLSYLGQLAWIGIYFFKHTLTVSNTLWITGITSAVALIVAVPLLPNLVAAPALLRIIFRRNWRSARYLAGATLLQWSSGNLFTIVAPVFLGAAAAGVMRGCQSITNMTNIWLQGLENSLPSEASRKWQKGGATGLRRYVFTSGALLGFGTAAVALVVAIAPEFWLHILYGSHMQGYGFVLRAYALLSVGIVLTLPLRAGLRALEDTSPILWGYAATTIYSLVSAPLLANKLGLGGVAWGLVGTQLILIPILFFSLNKRLRHA